MRPARLYTALGQSHSLREWASLYAISYAALYGRILKGEDLATALGPLRRVNVHRNGHRKDFQDLTGIVFHCLTVESYAGLKIFPSGQPHHNWWCRCMCGKLCQATTSVLQRKKTPKKSCGCQQFRGRAITHEGETRSLAAWARHYNISYSALGQRLRDGMPFTEAIDSPIGDVLVITYNGETLNLREWSMRTGISYSTLRWRFRQGWSDERIITGVIRQSHLSEVSHSHFLEAFGKRQTFAQWCKEYHMIRAVVALRMVERGMTLEDALTAPKWKRSKSHLEENV
jgi:hypothetical protein